MITSSETFEGGCDCRLIRYRLKRGPLFVHCCHCRWCQRETGSAFVLNALIETVNVELLHGDPEMIMTPSQSGRGQNIARCPRCRVALWSHYAGAGPLFTFIRVGTLDDPDRFPPDIHIFTASKQPWVVLSGDVPVMREYYRRDEYWPKEILARRGAGEAVGVGQSDRTFEARNPTRKREGGNGPARVRRYFGRGPRIGTAWPYMEVGSRESLFFSSASRYDCHFLSWWVPRSRSVSQE